MGTQEKSSNIAVPRPGEPPKLNQLGIARRALPFGIKGKMKRKPQMTKTLPTLLAALTLAWAGLSNADTPKSANHVPVENLKWFDTGIGPMQAAVAYGDMSKGPYGVFLKFPGGFVSPVHHHSAEYRAVVVAGTIVNSEVGEEDITMQPGSYWYQRGKVNHVTKCVSSDDCTVFLTQPSKFDFLPKEGDKH